VALGVQDGMVRREHLESVTDARAPGPFHPEMNIDVAHTGDRLVIGERELADDLQVSGSVRSPSGVEPEVEHGVVEQDGVAGVVHDAESVEVFEVDAFADNDSVHDDSQTRRPIGRKVAHEDGLRPVGRIQ
jgi:hypothetical protein